MGAGLKAMWDEWLAPKAPAGGTPLGGVTVLRRINASDVIMPDGVAPWRRGFGAQPTTLAGKPWVKDKPWIEDTTLVRVVLEGHWEAMQAAGAGMLTDRYASQVVLAGDVDWRAVKAWRPATPEEVEDDFEIGREGQVLVGTGDDTQHFGTTPSQLRRAKDYRDFLAGVKKA